MKKKSEMSERKGIVAENYSRTQERIPGRRENESSPKINLSTHKFDFEWVEQFPQNWILT